MSDKQRLLYDFFVRNLKAVPKLDITYSFAILECLSQYFNGESDDEPGCDFPHKEELVKIWNDPAVDKNMPIYEALKETMINEPFMDTDY